MDPPTQFQRGFMFPYLGKSWKRVTGEGLQSAGLLQQNIVAILLNKAGVTELLHCRGLTEGKKTLLVLSSRAALRCERTTVRPAAAEALRVCAQQNCALDNVKV